MDDVEIGRFGGAEVWEGLRTGRCTIGIGRWGSAKGWDILLDSKVRLHSPLLLILLVS